MMKEITKFISIQFNATMDRKLILYIAMSLDGYIAKPNDDLSFLKLVEKEGEDYGYAAFMATIDTIILGRKTYDWVKKQIGTAHYDNGDKNIIVLTQTPQPSVGKTVFCTENLVQLVQRLKSENGKNIFCDGGAQIVNALLAHKLIDEFIISIIPIFVGDGTRLFKDGRPEQPLQLVSSQHFDTGLVQLHYRRSET